MVCKAIENALKQLYQEQTQEEIARKLNVPFSTVNVLLSGKRKVSGLRLGTFDKMFPNATIDLFGKGNAICGNNNTAVSGNHNATGNNFFNSGNDNRIDRIIDAVMQDNDFSSDVKVRLFGIIKNTK